MSREYELIVSHYGANKAARSGVPLINHIDEGIAILRRLGASELAVKAFCLHPLLQSDEELRKNWPWVAKQSDAGAVLLAMEYRRAANAYLCKPETDDFKLADVLRVVGDDLIPEVRLMLIADKEQNVKDFNTHHRGTHVRSMQLARYFNMWREYLRVIDPACNQLQKGASHAAH